LRKNFVTAAAVAAGALTVLSFVPAHAAEYSSALKIRGVQYDAPGRDSNSCSSGNTDEEYLTVKNYSSRSTINLKGYVVKDATGNRFAFTANHYLQPGDYGSCAAATAPTPTPTTSSTATTATSCGTTTRTPSTCTSPQAAAPTSTPTPSAVTTPTATDTSTSTAE
jgi:cell division septation protein DedD